MDKRTLGKRILSLFCGLVILFLFASCEKEIKLTQYQIDLGMSEYTQPAEITDPVLRDFYMHIMTEVAEHLYELSDAWSTEITNDRFNSKDKEALAKYNSVLPKVKECEALCKKEIEQSDIQSISSFYMRVYCRLTRSVPADGLSLCLDEYSFELKYN